MRTALEKDRAGYSCGVPGLLRPNRRFQSQFRHVSHDVVRPIGDGPGDQPAGSIRFGPPARCKGEHRCRHAESSDIPMRLDYPAAESGSDVQQRRTQTGDRKHQSRLHRHLHRGPAGVRVLATAARFSLREKPFLLICLWINGPAPSRSKSAMQAGIRPATSAARFDGVHGYAPAGRRVRNGDGCRPCQCMAHGTGQM